MEPPAEGAVHTYERSFTVEEVRQFAEISRDRQPRHTEPDGEGNLLVHGLLTATLPTKIGGDLELLAHTMEFEFVRPVHTGETIVCRWRNEDVTEREERYAVTVDITCENEAGDTVLNGAVKGYQYKE